MNMRTRPFTQHRNCLPYSAQRHFGPYHSRELQQCKYQTICAEV
jgi:hypothetical protein